jgi:uncharacterized protein YqeY
MINQEKTMRGRLEEATRAALKSGNKPRLSALRLIRAAIQERDLAGRGPIGDAEIPAVLQRMIRQRRDAQEMYAKAGRSAQAQQEADEIAVIEEFLPAAVGESEMEAAIAEAIRAVGATGPKEMGKVMAALKERYLGRMDFAAASQRVRAHLSRSTPG